MKQLRGWLVTGGLLAVVIGSLPAEAAGRAGRTRGNGGSAARPSAAAPHRDRSGAAPRRVQGRATWGYGVGSAWRSIWWDSPWIGWGWQLGWGGYWWGPYGAGYGGWGPPYGGAPGWGGEVEVGGDAWIETDVRPKRATVRLDGEDVGVAKDWNGVWDRLPLGPGDHQIEFVLDGYMTLQVQLDARAGRVYHVDRELRRGEGLDPRSTTQAPRRGARRPSRDEGARERGERGYVRFSIEPEDAAVYLDGSFLARASELRRMHGTTSLPEGEHEVEVVRPGYRPERRRVRVEGEDVKEIEVVLEREE